jgi:predicted ATPase/signal transduction histidine kinase/CheY-like chemotaxis protein
MLTLPHYQIQSKIYESLNSIVYRGIRELDNQPVIFKLLKEDYPSPAELTRYRQEYEITHDLELSGVIKAYDIEKYDKTLVIILEDFGGESLKMTFEKVEQGRIAIADFLPLAIEIADNLGQIHRASIIHKDINPANIVWNKSANQLKIIDFGIASRLPREKPSLKNPEQLEGTLAYLSPEQTGRINRSIDYRTDLYSLGVTFYEMLTGSLPFQASNTMELVHCHIAKTPLSVLQVNPEVPPILSDIVMKLMAKNAEQRYQSAFGLKADLEKCLALSQNGFESKLKTLHFELGQNDFSGKFQIPQKLYGREKEVQILLQAFERIANPQNTEKESELMLVAGYSGVGKTALVHEVHKPMTEKHGHFIAGKFDQLGHNMPYSALSQAFNGFCHYLLTESVDILNQWRDKILKAVGNMGQVLIDVMPQLELIIGTQPAVEQIPPQEAQNRFNLVFQNFLNVFCTHPLILFIDDLQWADSASLNLLTHLMTDAKIHHLFIIGAYRDNEVNSTHPLMRTVNALQKASVRINTIVLQNLSQNDVDRLIAESLNCDIVLTQELTQLVYEKTQGNAFFTHEFLKSLSEQGLLNFDITTQAWQWNAEKIGALEITDNVVELLSAQISQLPSNSIEVLKLAACIGNQFDLNTLSIISESKQKQTLAHLWPAINAGLILPQDDNYKWVQETHKERAFFKFLHDRVQQAAYTLIDETQKKNVHLSIGQLLQNNTHLQTEPDKLFKILDHLNIARSLIVDPQQQVKLAQLNLMAGIKAKQATAYVAALQYLIIGMTSIGKQTWTNHYDLALALHKEKAELEFLNGHFEESEQVIHQTVERVKTPLEKAEVLHILIVQYTLSARYPKAIETGRQALALLGIELPDQHFEQVRDQEMQEIKTMMGDSSIASLFDLPNMTDPIYMMAVKLLITMGPPCYRSHQRLWGVIVAKVVHLTLQYGNVPQIGYSHTAYGGLLGYVWQDYTTGKALGEVATRLMNEKFTHSSAAQSVFYLMIGSSVRHWYEPFEHATQDYYQAYNIGLESGNLQYAVYAFGHNMYCRFYQGINLPELFTEVEGYLAFCRSRKNQWGIDLMEAGQLVILNLMQRIEETTTTQFDKPELTETQFVERCEAHKNIQVLCIFYILKTQALYLHGHIEQAIKSAKEAEKRIISVATQGLLPSSQHRFMESFLLLARYPETSPEEQQHHWKKLIANQHLAKSWVNNCPENFQAQYLLISAEMARLSGHELEAIDLYDQGIACAQKNGFLQHEALGNELAAQFWFKKGKEAFGKLYLKNAHYSYQLWGAKPKVKALEERYPELLYHSPFPKTQSTIVAETINVSGTRHIANSSALDLESLMKAAQTLSGEMVLGQLLEKMMIIVIENAGAERGCLLLPQQENWFIEAEGHINSKNVLTLQSIAIENSEQLSTNIIHYIARTQEHVVLSDATQETRFNQEPYIIKYLPKSILGMPLLNQGKLTGILYLENRVTEGAFTAQRLQVLNMLSSQMAISLENSILYNNLENKVAERTQALQQEIVERKRAEDAAKIASQAKSEFLSNMSHELRTPLNGILGYTQILKRNRSLNTMQMDSINIIHQSGKHLLTLINDILDLSKIEARKMTLYPTDVLLQTFIDGIVGIIRMRAEEKNILFKLDIPSALPSGVNVDEKRLRQILINLLGNAVKFTKQGKVILRIIPIGNKQVIGELNKQTLRFEVEDQGVGMSPKELDKIFLPFEQVGDKEARQAGTGLGLAISRQLVTLMGGTLQVKSEKDQGSVFWFEITLPVVQKLTSDLEEVITQQVKGYEGKRRTILVVDDKQENRLMMLSMLEPLGFQIELAKDGQEEIDKAKEIQPDLILTDLVMPVKSGFEAVQAIRNIPVLKDIPIIAVSASVFDMDQTKSQVMGCNAFLAKPIDEGQLLSFLSKYMNLTWIYDTQLPLEVKQEGNTDENQALIAPPKDDLEILYELAMMGSMRGIREKAQALEELNKGYRPFAHKLIELAKGFEDKQIIALVDQYLTEEE